MEAFLKDFEHLKHFNLEEIKSITGDFDNNKVIGEGGFGKVYEGLVSDSMGQKMVAFKRLSSNCGQGNPEFLKEILILSTYKHENLISLLGFCDQDREKILVYEHASNGSFDRHLSSTTLTWTQRLKICLGAAKALCYLHDPKETHQRVIHRDIKSSNILLDGNWNAKLSDMGLSKLGPANQAHTFLATNVVGTFFYVDPKYMETSILTKESDVYSFGVVLFEVLCGSLCFEIKDNRHQSLVPRWKKSYKEKKLDEIIFPDLKQDMDVRSLKTFSEIAYQYLQKSREQRPKMSLVVEKLKIALQFQEPEITVEKFKEKVKNAGSKEELEMLLFNGIIINGGTEITVEKFKEKVKNAGSKEELEMLLFNGIIINGGTEITVEKFKEKVKNAGSKEELEMLLFNGIIINGGTEITVEKFKEKVKNAGSKEELEMLLFNGIIINGGTEITVEKFKEKVKNAGSKEELEMLLFNGIIINGGTEITVEKFKEKVKNAGSKEELEMLLFNGIIINGGNTWFSLNKNGEHCEMISGECFIVTTAVDPHDYVPYAGENKSRFEVSKRSGLCKWFRICERTQFLSPNITYKVNLVFKFVDLYKKWDSFGIEYWLTDELMHSSSLVTHERGDGWLTTELYQFITDTSNVNVRLDTWFRCHSLIEVEGIEFLPLEKQELLLEGEDVDLQTDTYWEQKLPSDYEDIIKWSKDNLQWTTKKELYSIFCKGFPINTGEEWFFVAKNGKKCHMLSAKLALGFPSYLKEWQSLPESRFGEVASGYSRHILIDCRSNILSPQTTYATYLVYKSEEYKVSFKDIVECTKEGNYHDKWHICLLRSQAPVITGKAYQKRALPQQRNDGWMEVQVYEFRTDTERISIDFRLSLNRIKDFRGLIMHGIEFRPT